MRLDIAVDDAQAMRRAHTGANLHGNVHGACHGKGAFTSDDGFQVTALDVFHDDVLPVAVVAQVIHGDDVGMAEVGRRLRLAHKALLEGGVLGKTFAQDFYGHDAVEHGVLRFVDQRHPARRDLREQFVAIVEQLAFQRHRSDPG